MKKFLVLLFLFVALFCSYVYGQYKTDRVAIKYLDNKEKEYDIVYSKGRLYLPLFDICNDFNMEYKKAETGYYIIKDDKTTFIHSSKAYNDMCVYNGKGYVYLYNITEPFELIPTIDAAKNRIDIYNSINNDSTYLKTSASSPKKAYIRLEDIVADGLDTSLTPNYSAKNLEKLIYTGKYLYDNGQAYYVAWIPVYANPKIGYWNDVSANFNLYNSYFVYALDYLSKHNGHIGLHGYTHQYGNDISAIGYEWGSNTPYSTYEQELRIQKAIACSKRLGLNIEFFEFPHYGATKAQMNMASKYFNFIYQSYPKPELSNNFVYSSETGKRVYYLPTPSGFLHTKYNLDNLLLNLNNSIYRKETVSLFYHPVIDMNYAIEINNKGSDRIWKYDSNGCLPNIVEFVSKYGYVFSAID